MVDPVRSQSVALVSTKFTNINFEVEAALSIGLDISQQNPHRSIHTL